MSTGTAGETIAPDKPSGKPKPRKPTLAHRAEYYTMRATIGALRALPWDAACKVGERLGELGYRPLGIRKNVVEKQIAAAFPELDHPAVVALARDSYRHLGRTFIETALMDSLGKDGVLQLVESVEGWEIVDGVMSKGRGAVMVTGHFGNWELAGSYVAARGVPLDAIVRGMANPLFDGYVNRAREAIGMTVVHDSEAVRRTPRSLRGGRAVAFVADQGVMGLASTFVPFFGRPAKTPRGAAVFALRFEVPVIFVVAIRQPNGRFRIVVERIEAVRTASMDHDVDAIVATFTEHLEKWVRVVPAQYFWQHRRWRRQPPDTPPELRDPSAQP
ncbi:MAG TPA: lysophospholipid acyltransferase family protein [Gemmatimonadaceae bacterium]|jgi:KDO2-lipid IV(A) lauroyltransferase|nr:lysophospholipid acyltransferase family protein [Gemmatimonadaceae bacterium]